MYKKIIIFVISFLFLGFFNVNLTFAQVNNGTGIIINDSSELGFDGRIITLYGENFGTGGEVIVKGGTFTKIEWGNNKIVGKLPLTLSDLDIYIQSNGKKSNTYKLKVKLPHMNYIYGEKGFYNGNIIKIVGDNLDHYKTTKVEIDSKIVEGDYKNFRLNNLSLGKHTIKILSGGYESNIIEIDIFSKSIILKSVKKKYQNHKPFIQLDFNQKLINTGSYILYNNKNIVNSPIFNSNIIKVNDYNLNYPNNFFRLKMNNTYSNVLNLKNTNLMPNIISFNLGSSFGSNKILDKRIIDLFITNFDITKDKVYYNDSILDVLSCKGNTCRVLIPYKSYSGYFTVGDGINKNPKKFIYNIKYDNIPLVNNFSINGKLKPGSDFYVLGSNLDKVTISSTNLFFDNRVFYSFGSIKSIVGYKYDNTKKSSITFTSDLWTKTITFSGGSIISDNFTGPSIVKEFITDKKNTLFYPGTKVNLIGKGFHKGDIVNIGKYKIKLNLFGNYFNLPSDIKSGEYTVNIENKFGVKSEDSKIIILEKKYDSIFIKGNKVDNSIFETDTKYDTGVIYSLDFTNKITDINLKKIQFNIKNYAPNDYLGTFILKLDGKEVGKSLINEKGEIIFDNNFEILKSVKTYKLDLYKDSIYLNSGKYYITLDTKSLNLSFSKNYKKFFKINFTNLKSSIININKKSIINCYYKLTMSTIDTTNNACDKFKVKSSTGSIENNFTGTIIKENKNIDNNQVKSNINTNINNKSNSTNLYSNNTNLYNKSNSTNLYSNNTNLYNNTNLLNTKYSVNIDNKALISRKLVLYKIILGNDRIYKKYISIIDSIIDKLKTSDIKMVNLHNKLEKLSPLKGGIGKVINYLKGKLDSQIYLTDSIIKVYYSYKSQT